MNYLGLGVVGRAGARLVSSCKDLYNDLNGANLTGAVDVVVVIQTDGTYKATPFHVRFGKWGVLRTGDLQKEVEVEVNGEPVRNRMMLDENGSAFFVKPKHSASIDVPPGDSNSEFVFYPRSRSMGSVPDPIRRSSENLVSIDSVISEELVSNEALSDAAFIEEKNCESFPLPSETNMEGTSCEDETKYCSVDNNDVFGDGVNGDVRVSVDENSRLTGVLALVSSDQSGGSSDNDDDSDKTGDGVTGESVIGDGVPGDSVTGDCVVGDSVTGDNVTGDCVVGDSVVGDGVTGDDVVIRAFNCDSSDDSPLKLQPNKHFKLQDDVADDKAFLTPTDNLEEFQWMIHKRRGRGEGEDNQMLSSQLYNAEELDSGVLSDSAIELVRERCRPVTVTMSDSELEERKDNGGGDGGSGGSSAVTRTEGEVSSLATATTKENIPRSKQLAENEPRYSLWGAIRGIWSGRKRRRFSSIEEGIYLDELDSGRLKEDEKALYLPPLHSTTCPHIEEEVLSDSSGVDTSSPQPSPLSGDTADDELNRIINMLSDVSISRCGFNGDDVDEKSFAQHEISLSEFCSNPDMLTNNDDVVVRIDGKYYCWPVAAPMIMSAILYQRLLPTKAQNDLERKHVFRNKSKQSLWRKWSKEASDEKFGKSENESLMDQQSKSTDATIHIANNSTAKPVAPSLVMSQGPLSSDEEEEVVKSDRNMSRVRQRSLRRKRFIFTNELTSEELSKWPLKPGKNDLVFSITTKYQGTARATCSLYLWSYNDRIVVSDFDGTITRSDVAGQVLPFLGKDWTHFGVIELFSKINENGYKFLYLSARAIGQSMYTKNYLRSTRSRNCYLPDGPLLVTPFSLYKAFKKEVIERKPEEFKILCLQQIRTFFPEDYNPFHAGFGNKPSDAKSYLEVKIPSSRIYTVNPKGELKNELTWTFQSSYLGLMEFVDGQFPPLDAAATGENVSVIADTSNEGTEGEGTAAISWMLAADDGYSSFQYWQHSLNSFDMFDLPDS